MSNSINPQNETTIAHLAILLSLLKLVSLPITASAPTPSPTPLRSLLPLFRAANSSELASASASKIPIVWSAHEPADSMLIISNSSAISLACLLDGGGNSAERYELSWSVKNPSSGLSRRHTLSSSQGSGRGRQAFSLDLGPEIRSASGFFDSVSGSLITIEFPSAPVGRGVLEIACHLRLGGSIVATSARLRLWDERPVRATLVETQNKTGLPCRRVRWKRNSSNATALDCALVPSASPSAAAAVLETAVYVLYNCKNKAKLARQVLQSNSTDPATFYAVYFAGALHLGWTKSGDWDSGNFCLSADALLPSGKQRVHLDWRLKIQSDNNGTNYSEAAFVPDMQAAHPPTVEMDYLTGPPLTRALPCPFLCLAGQTDSNACKFSWLLSRNCSNLSEALQIPDPSLGILVESHRLVLTSWQPLGNPIPSPLAGFWTCRSAASLSAGDFSTLPAQQFHVRVTSRPVLCGNRPPARSVVFVPPPNSSQTWPGHQSLKLNFTVCGLNRSSASSAASFDTQVQVHGSTGRVEVLADSKSHWLPNGGLELSLRFTKFSLDGNSSTGGSVLVRCRSADAKNRGLVAFVAVEAFPTPTKPVCKSDCPSKKSARICRRFRCPMKDRLAATLPALGVSAAFLFTTQPYGGAPPQQTLSSEDHLELSEPVARLRCAQLLYYSDSQGLDEDISGGRRQRFIVKDSTLAAAYRTALGGRRFSRLVLAIESGWLELGSSLPASMDAIAMESRPSSSSNLNVLSASVYASAILAMIMCCLGALFPIVMILINGKNIKDFFCDSAQRQKCGKAADSETKNQHHNGNEDKDKSKTESSQTEPNVKESPDILQAKNGTINDNKVTDVKNKESLHETGGTFVSLGSQSSKDVVIWATSSENEVCKADTYLVSSKESLTRNSPEEIPKSSQYRLYQPAKPKTASTQAYDQQLTSTFLIADEILGVGVASNITSAAVATVNPVDSGEKLHFVERFHARDGPQFHTGALDKHPVDDGLTYDKTAIVKDSVIRCPTPPLEEKLELSVKKDSYSADMGRVNRCLICEPPKTHLASKMIMGNELSLDCSSRSSSTSTASTNSSKERNENNCIESLLDPYENGSYCTVKEKFDAQTIKSEEVDIPSSDNRRSTLVANGSTVIPGGVLFATASTAVLEVAESSLIGASQKRGKNFDSKCEDECSTCTCTGTGYSTDTDEPANKTGISAPKFCGEQTRCKSQLGSYSGMEASNSDIEPAHMQFVRDAVNSAIERLVRD